MPWIQFIIETDADHAPEFSEWLSETGAAAVTLQDSADQPLYEPPPGAQPLWQRTRVVALYPAETDVAPLVDALRARSAPEEMPAHRIEALEDKDWSRAWMDDFKPMQFGTRLWIVPSWHQPPDPEGVNILLDPGLAFGTGTHPTTRLCLRWLDGAELTGATVVDYGCGSGILAVAAARLGAARVWGVDNDPQALLATEENARRNDVAGAITTLLPEQVPDLQADALVANILAGPLVSLAPRLAMLVRPGGHLALSGILPEQADAVSTAYRDWFEMAPAEEEEGWVRLAGERRSTG